MTAAINAAIESAFAEEWGRIVAGVIGRTGDWDLAEDCAAQAFAEAVRRWPREGVPARPGAWLTTVARNRAVDRLRHERMRAIKLRALAAKASADVAAEREPEADPSGIEDERLRLIFTCCHPALPLEGRVALTLRTLAGLTTAEIARAFGVPEATMAKRLVRAKAKIANAAIPYRVPSAELLPARLGGVLAVLYLLFSEGYAASSGDDLIRAELCADAIRLTRALRALMPDADDAGGLLALMLLQDSRRTARTDAAGDLVTLSEQDRALWNRAAIAEAGAVLAAIDPEAPSGPYRLQALIAACHSDAPRAEATDWVRIATLYGRLAEVAPGPHVALNRAVAVGFADGFGAGLELLDALAGDAGLTDSHLFHAARADFLRRLGHTDPARAAYERALELAPTEAERRFLSLRLGECGG